jgi:hypothetical protein
MEWRSFCWAIVVYTCIVNGFRKVAVDVVDRFVAHHGEQSAFPATNFLQIVTRVLHSTDAGWSARWKTNLILIIFFHNHSGGNKSLVIELTTFFFYIFNCRKLKLANYFFTLSTRDV